jgi:RNA polymerase sigma-70 factor (ECF subfamily)
MQQLGEESQWIQAALQGDQEAFARLIEQYTSSVFNLCYRMLGSAQDAEDATQEIFFRVYARLGSYDLDRRFSTWLLSIASNYCIDRLRRRKFAWVTLEDTAFMLPSNEAGPERRALQRERADIVQAALQNMPSQYRLVLVLRYWQDMSYNEIATLTGLSESALKTRLHRARKQLAEALQEDGATLWDVETTTG